MIEFQHAISPKVLCRALEMQFQNRMHAGRQRNKLMNKKATRRQCTYADLKQCVVH